MSCNDCQNLPPYGNATLPAGIRSRCLPGVNGLTVHILEAGFEAAERPLVLLLHGFPELAYTWRSTLLPLAAAGYHVVAPDRRGYGRTTGWDDSYDADLAPFGILNMVRDCLALVAALRHRTAAAVIGHDFGSPIAGWCGIVRPDVFRSVGLMSAPFTGAPAFCSVTASQSSSTAATEPRGPTLHEQLAALTRPRKHYMRYFTTREANRDMWTPSQGLPDFLRAYFHVKSADCEANEPFELRARTAAEMQKLPTYYVMDHAKSMATTVAAQMPSAQKTAAASWLTEQELDVYVSEYQRTGFQGGLQGYRCGFDMHQIDELRLFGGRTLDVPAIFVAGEKDWGVYQIPGAKQLMQNTVCTSLSGVHLVEDAGHWVQQEQADTVNELLLNFLSEPRGAH